MKKITSKKWVSEANKKENSNEITIKLFNKNECLSFFEENTFFEKSENGKTIIFQSKQTKNTTQTNRLICIDFEKLFDSVDSNLSQKCDYVFINYYNQQYYFVELKGNAERISKPYEQIKISIDLFKQRMNINKSSIIGIIVGGKVERKSSTKEKNVKLIKTNVFRNNFISELGKDLFHAQNKAAVSSPLSSKDDFIGS
ncbi:hypothetical protein V9L05_09800 [Bernardetia sp. Wsw4-3y2]|uniref:hypothetical protein n=1 Tax=Bernardetia sp. Wsw4-3y2 TaxID=3127471 RepID=UPI0030D34268